MAKQIKIGFDKTPAPVTESFPQLQDIEGNLLYDTAGNPLLTEEKGELSGFSTAANSTSLHVNNSPLDKDGYAGPVPVEEQFPDISPVSNTLLGVPRAEEQLSLFSDVSTYGLDEDNWVKYIYSNHGVHPREWYYRRNPVYGNRSETEFVEETNEQALYLKSFPTQYGYSASPRWGNTTDTVPSPSTTHVLYMKFIAMGKFLFEKYNSIPEYKEYAARNFIDRTIKIIDSNDEEVVITTESFEYDAQARDFTSSPPQLNDTSNYYTVDYGPITETSNAFAKIEAWTMVWQGIISEEFQLPVVSDVDGNSVISFLDKNAIRVFLTQETRPGGSTNIERFGLIESKQTFRYQPGRISGFTFGTRMKTPGERSSDVIEWGCGNNTDEYIFQLRGIEWSIIRRSTIPLGKALLERQGLDEDAERLVYPVRLDNDQQVQEGVGEKGTHWETKISRDRWNGDSLLGTGRSGYTISFENVTMYKIEFSWYGAIGAKFYAYVPTGNGEARWILLHTFVIENGMGEPVLNNPDLKFRYLLYNTDTEFVTSPSYVYKYGSSYYIDGGDEGTVRLTSFTGNTKTFTERTPIVGLLPKNKITNSTNDLIENNKRIFPEKISVNSTQAARIDIEAINGSPFGGHYFYSPSLHNGDSELSQKNVRLQFSQDGSKLYKYDENGVSINWTPEENGSHVIADGIYNVYVGVTEESDAATVLRRGRYDYSLSEANIAERVRLSDGTTFRPRPTDAEFAGLAKAFTAKLTNYNSLAVCTIPLTENRFKIHFLNPVARDSRHFNDFFISLTEKTPRKVFNEETETNEILFDTIVTDTEGESQVQQLPFNKDTEFTAEWSCDSVTYDVKDREYQEQDWEIGIRLEVDVRLPNPQGGNSGRISSLKGEVATQSYPVDSIAAANDADPLLEEQGIDRNAPVDNGWYKIVFTKSSPASNVLTKDGNSEVGYFEAGTGTYYVSELLTDSNTNKGYCYISGDPSANISRELNQIKYVQSKTVTIKPDWQLEGYNEDGSQRFGSHRWSISRGTIFNIQPLYLVFGMTDRARINNIYVEQITETGVSTFTPRYMFTEDGPENSPSIQEVQTGGSSNVSIPAAFEGNTRLSGIRFDSSLTQPLRPGTNIYSFYVGANQPTTIDLSNIFNFDRKTISKGLLNNIAYYITATGELQDQLDDEGNVETVRVGGDIEVSLTVKEQ
jgi:hypothetical protein